MARAKYKRGVDFVTIDPEYMSNHLKSYSTKNGTSLQNLAVVLGRNPNYLYCSMNSKRFPRRELDMLNKITGLDLSRAIVPDEAEEDNTPIGTDEEIKLLLKSLNDKQNITNKELSAISVLLKDLIELLK